MKANRTSQLTLREQLMLPAAFVIAIVVLYGTARLKYANRAVQELKDQHTQAINTRASLQFPKASPHDASALRNRLQQLNQELATANDRLQTGQAQLADPTDGNQIQNLKIEISSLAQDNGLTIVETIPYDSDAADRSQIVANYSGDPRTIPSPDDLGAAPVIYEYIQLLYARPLQMMTVQSSFAELLRFISGFDSLSHQVTVVNFEIQADIKKETEDAASTPLLTSRLLVAF